RLRYESRHYREAQPVSHTARNVKNSRCQGRIPEPSVGALKQNALLEDDRDPRTKTARECCQFRDLRVREPARRTISLEQPCGSQRMADRGPWESVKLVKREGVGI